MTKITNNFLSAESLHTNTIYIRKTRINGDRTQTPPPPIVYFLLTGLILAQFWCKTRYFGNIAYDLKLNSLFRIKWKCIVFITWRHKDYSQTEARLANWIFPFAHLCE